MRIGVIGAGSWGSALADLIGREGFKVDLWVFEKEIMEQIQTHGENKVFLPGVALSENLRPTNDIRAAAGDKDLVLMVTPSHVLRKTAEMMAGSVSETSVVISASKGIENGTHLIMTDVLGEALPHVPRGNFAVLSGPSFAGEVARDAPTVVTAASEREDTAGIVQRVFSTPCFRVYSSHDMMGVQLGGAIKNVIAIASGIIDGLKLGLNTRAALITRGLTEIRRIGMKMGADPRTFSGPAGVGDLLLTCTGAVSRNHTVGKRIGEGMKLKDILADMRMVAEGVRTAKSVYNLSRKIGVEMPICHEIHRILYDDASPAEAVRRLMTRDLRHELDEV
ncbi:MAG: NAD(P)-dependent glycerol-3-phosphate dehydrogenase [Desulfobacterales bacterium]|nr:NAD(P)-dependent glycerol-3-phosphate dehydrogenase [Desulfobacterales bacterium]